VIAPFLGCAGSPCEDETFRAPRLLALRRFPRDEFRRRLILPRTAMGVGSLDERLEQRVGRQRF